MMTVTFSMMDVTNQCNSVLQASGTLFLSLCDRVFFTCSCSGRNDTAPHGLFLGESFPVADIDVTACEGLLKGVLS